jgi:uncharacterized membrane protein
MNDDGPIYRSGVVRPLECLRGGWELIKGRYWLFMGLTLVGMLIAGAGPMGILMGPMMCGIYLCLLRHARGRTVKFEMLFQGFEHFLPSLIATLIMMIPALVILIPAYAVFFVYMFSQMPQPGQPAPPNPDGIWTLLAGMGAVMAVVFIVSVVVSALFFFTYQLIVDRKMSGTQAIATSVRAARANFIGVLGLVLLTNFFTLLGMLACYIGAFFVLPIHFAAAAVAYQRVFPDEEEMPDERSDYTDEPELKLE